MVNRKLQKQHGSFFLTIPPALIDSMGITSGDSLDIIVENGKIMISARAGK